MGLGLPRERKAPGDNSFRVSVKDAPIAFAIARGPDHILVFGNPAFLALTSSGSREAIDLPLSQVISGPGGIQIAEMLDEVYRTGVQADQVDVGKIGTVDGSWGCTAWPLRLGGDLHGLQIIELRIANAAERLLGMQRAITERMLLTALREGDAAEKAEEARKHTSVLADASRKLAMSLDRSATLDVVARLALPHFGSWCIVDALEADGNVTRLPIIHADTAKQILARTLQGQWSPEPGDPFGAAAIGDGSDAIVINENVESAIVKSAHSPNNLRILRELGTGPLLTVPLVANDRAFGSITFVGAERDHPYTEDDVNLAKELASRSAMALDSASRYQDALDVNPATDSRSNSLAALLGNMSHELRTPLNAIGGYVDLIDMGIRGPVNDAQHTDLARIRSCQRHLIGIVTEILDFVRLGSGSVEYHITDFDAFDSIHSAMDLVQPLLEAKGVTYTGIVCDEAMTARADTGKVQQILVNLIANAIKFTPASGSIGLECMSDSDFVILSVKDTGIGIPAEKVEAVFEPFIQVRDGLAGRDGGVGLGLAISRTFARAMGGDLKAESVLGEGSRFMLSLPKGVSGDSS